MTHIEVLTLPYLPLGSTSTNSEKLFSISFILCNPDLLLLLPSLYFVHVFGCTFFLLYICF